MTMSDFGGRGRQGTGEGEGMSEPKDPVGDARRLARPELPRRFYKHAAAAPYEAGFALFLDGKLVKTPGRGPLVVAAAAVAAALAAEWDRQGERIDPATMPFTRIVNAAIDHVAAAEDAVRAEIVKYAASDLICYRAEAPGSLVAAQLRAWDPLVAWALNELGAPLIVATGIMHVPQPDVAIAAIARAVAPFGGLALAALSTVATVTGSAVVALAVARGRLTAEEAWAAAIVDEDWQISQWGRDELAAAAHAMRWREVEAAALILTAS
jgi:chaperone required for assembly of F1-ATPase